METHESIEELEAKAHEMLRRANELRHAKRTQFIAETRIKMKELGVTAEDLQEMRKPSRIPKNTSRFRDPRTGSEWTGRGRAPNWYKAAERAGNVDSLRIDEAAEAAH